MKGAFLLMLRKLMQWINPFVIYLVNRTTIENKE